MTVFGYKAVDIILVPGQKININTYNTAQIVFHTILILQSFWMFPKFSKGFFND